MSLAYKRFVTSVLVLVWMAVIFSFSAKPADESADMSHSVGRIVGRFFLPSFEEWDIEAQQAFAEQIDYPVRKTAHATEYAVLGMLLMGAAGTFLDKRKGDRIRGFRMTGGRCRFRLSVVIGTIYAASDEFHQLFVPGRSGQISDVMVDSAGVLAGIFLFLAFNRIIFHIKKKFAG